MACAKAISSLVSVTLTGKVSFSALGVDSKAVANVTKGESMSISFLIDPEPLFREIEGQGVVYDGIAPYPICSNDFALSLSSVKWPFARLGPAPVLEDGTTGSFYFSLMKSRPVNDGAWISMNAVQGSIGVPLALHGVTSTAKYNGVFEVRFERDTLPAKELPAAFGTYTTDGLLWSQLKITRDWDANVVVTATFDSLTIAPATSRL